MREKVKDILVCPFRLIEIIHIFRETCQIDNTEERAACRPSIWSRLAYIVKAGPDILSAYEFIVSYKLESFLVGIAPWNMAVLI